MPYIDAAAPFVALGAFAVALIAVGVGFASHRRIARLTLRRGDSLEDTMGELSRRAREFQVFREEVEQYLAHSEARLQRTLRVPGVVRFNPFEGDGSGGNQSFAAAFLDEHGNGVALSAIYARGGQSSVYAKPVEKGKSTFELTDEEREAIRKTTERNKPPAIPKPIEK